jgi:hypothetical protein
MKKKNKEKGKENEGIFQFFFCQNLNIILRIVSKTIEKK